MIDTIRIRNRGKARLWAHFAQDDLHHDALGVDASQTADVPVSLWARVLVAAPRTVGPTGLGPDRPRDVVADAALRDGIGAARAEGLTDAIAVARRAVMLAVADGAIERFVARDDQLARAAQAELARLDREALAAREREAGGNA